MPISIKKAALFLALALSKDKGKEVAIRFKGDGKVMGIGVNDSTKPEDSQSEIINILQATKASFGPFIATSTKPSVRSRGMAAMQGIRQVLYLDVDRIRFFSYKNYKETQGVYQAEPKDNILKLNDIDKINSKVDPKQAALDWYKQIEAAPPGADPEKKFWDSYKKSSEYLRYQGPDLPLPNGLKAVAGGRQDTPLRHDIFMKLAWAIVGEASTKRGEGAGQYPFGHNIGSVLRGPDDKILGWGINTNKGKPSLHGEVNLIQNYHRTNQGGAIDSKAILYSTLEPCHMCAGMYAQSGQNMLCYFAQDDPGITDNALVRNEFGSQEILRLEGLGKLTTSAMNSQLKIYSNNKDLNSKAITHLLNRTISPLIQHAVFMYFDLFSGLTKDTPDYIIWQNGFRLLMNINPGVVDKFAKYDLP